MWQEDIPSSGNFKIAGFPLIQVGTPVEFSAECPVLLSQGDSAIETASKSREGGAKPPKFKLRRYRARPQVALDNLERDHSVTL